MEGNPSLAVTYGRRTNIRRDDSGAFFVGALEFRSDQMDAIIERWLPTICEKAHCPECGAPAIRAGDETDRIRYRLCEFMSPYSLGTPFLRLASNNN